MRLTIERVLATTEIRTLYPLYLTAFHPLVTQAAARHVLTPAEFDDEMRDPRIDKILVRDHDDRIIGLTTITRELSAVAWVNAGYYRAHFPEVVARSAMFYVGYVLVDPARRRTDALVLMAEQINDQLSAAEGVLAFDICAFNDAHGVGRRIREIFYRAGTISPVDTQTYYAADYRPPAGPRRIDGVVSAPDEGPLRHGTLQERPELAAGLPALLDELRTAGPRVPDRADDFGLESLAEVPTAQIVVSDDAGRLRGGVLWFPVTWDGSPQGLPRSWEAARELGLGTAASGASPDAVVVLPLLPDAELASAECTTGLIRAVRTAAAHHATAALVLARPVRKRRYPLIPVEDYLAWRTPTGDVFDTALSLHVKLGAEIMAAAEGPVRTAARVQWQEALGVPIPGDGVYVLDGGLSPLEVAQGVGRYQEPRVWLRYSALVLPDGPGSQSSHKDVT